MHYHVLTLFPEMIVQGLGTSVIGRAMEQGIIQLTATNIRDYSTNKHMKVDDYPYGGGAGMVMQAETSVIGRAMEQGIIQLTATNIRDYSTNKHMKVDDYPYGGGAGMVMQAEPVYGACKAVEEEIGYKPRVIYLTPQGKVFNQSMVEDFAKEKDLVFLCGHYEGIDERVLEEVVTDYVSIGWYFFVDITKESMKEYWKKWLQITFLLGTMYLQGENCLLW